MRRGEAVNVARKLKGRTWGEPRELMRVEGLLLGESSAVSEKYRIIPIILSLNTALCLVRLVNTHYDVFVVNLALNCQCMSRRQQLV